MPYYWISTFAGPLATILAAVLVVVGVPLIGVLVYFKQKEYETIRQRYLDDGISIIIRQVEYGLDVFSYNWAHSIHLLRTYRDLGANTPPELYNSGFLDIDKPISMEASRHYLLKDVIGDKVFFDVHQLFVGFLHEADNLFKVDLCSAIRVSLEGGKNGTVIDPPEKIFETYKEELAKKNEECKPYYSLLGNLKILDSVLSQKQYSFKSLSKLHAYPEVIKSIADLKVVFKDQLARYTSPPSDILSR